MILLISRELPGTMRPNRRPWEAQMTDDKKRQDAEAGFWYSGKVSRRRLIGYGGGVIGAAMLVPAPWRAAFGQAKPFKNGSSPPPPGAAPPCRRTPRSPRPAAPPR